MKLLFKYIILLGLIIQTLYLIQFSYHIGKLSIELLKVSLLFKFTLFVFLNQIV